MSGPRKLNPVDLSLYAVTDSSLNEKLGHSMEDVSHSQHSEQCIVVQCSIPNLLICCHVTSLLEGVKPLQYYTKTHLFILYTSEGGCCCGCRGGDSRAAQREEHHHLCIC